jgi:hypothetical protein
MYTTMLLFALTGLPAADAAEGPAWLTDYGSAQKQGREEKKPLAVFFGSGKDGWSKVARNGKLGKEVEQLLADSYVCVYLDTDTAKGQKMAAAMEVESGKGLVLSDRGGVKMAFYHDGDLTTAKLTSYLKKYADPDVVVEWTETNPPATRSSYYPNQYQQPAYNYGGFGGGRGGC